MSAFDNPKLLAHLRAKWGNRPCPMCGAGSWNVQDKVFQLMEFQDGTLVLGGPIIPVIPVTCANCGNTVLVNGLLTGLVAPTPGAAK